MTTASAEKSGFNYYRPSMVSEIGQPSDFSAWLEIVADAVNAPLEVLNLRFRDLPHEQRRVLKSNNTLSAGLAYHDLKQVFGGAGVRCAAVTMVGVVPGSRGTGAGRFLMEDLLRDLHKKEFAISTLFASTQSFYQKLGYAFSGSLMGYSVASSDFRFPFQMSDVRIEPATGRFELIKKIREKAVLKIPGEFQFDDSLWSRLFHPHPNGRHFPSHIYLAFEGENPTGYVCFKKDKYDGVLTILDFHALTTKAFERLALLLQSHEAVHSQFVWNGSFYDRFLQSLMSRKFISEKRSDWSLRLIHLKKAFEERGYPKILNVTVNFQIHDSLFPENCGIFELGVENGQGHWKKLASDSFEKGDFQNCENAKNFAQISIESLASLYTGYATAQELMELGKLSGSEETIEILNLLFCSGAKPSLNDGF